MSLAQMSDLWWKNAVIYCLDIETFYDSNGDGWGDLTGLIERIEYLADLGVTCLWLMPFYPSPGRDDGYDITDYGVDTSLGTLGDFVVLIRAAKDRAPGHHRPSGESHFRSPSLVPGKPAPAGLRDFRD